MKYLTIFLTYGSTLRFEQVTNFKEDLLADIEFDYVSASSQEQCHAVFSYSNIAGFSYTKE